MDATEILPMFPLGSVLFPGMPLALRVFEERYLLMLRDVLTAPERLESDAPASAPREFGVVLIERGFEVGGGDARFNFGTIARVGDVMRAPQWINVLARGTERFEIVDWLGEVPYPRARIRRLPQASDDAPAELLRSADKAVHRSLALASEFEQPTWGAAVKLPGEGIELAWRLCGVAPLGPLDQQGLLGATSASGLLVSLIDKLDALEQTWLASMDAPEGDPDGQA